MDGNSNCEFSNNSSHHRETEKYVCNIWSYLKLVSDSGTTFTSLDFENFMKRNGGIHHIRTAPYHPSSNGQVERAVQIFKEGMKRSTTGTLETRVSRFLFHFRNTPHTTTGVTPAEIMMGRQLSSHLSCLIPDTAARIATKQQNQKEAHDNRAKKRIFKVGDSVFVRDFPAGNSWLSGFLVGKCGPLSYTIELEDHWIIRQHVDHIRLHSETSQTTQKQKDGVSEDFDAPTTDSLVDTQETPQSEGSTPPLLRRSSRICCPPDRYQPDQH